VSLKSRLRRLDAGVRWLETEGVFLRLKHMTRLVEIAQDIADHTANDPGFAKRWNKRVPSLPLPPPRAKVRRPRVRPILRDAPLRSAPQDEAVRVDTPKSAAPHPEERPERPRLEGCEPARAPPPPPRPPKPRWTKDNRPGPHDVLSWEEAMQVPWVDSSAEDDKA
jgi:hypothetical protein